MCICFRSATIQPSSANVCVINLAECFFQLATSVLLLLLMILKLISLQHPGLDSEDYEVLRYLVSR